MALPEKDTLRQLMHELICDLRAATAYGDKDFEAVCLSDIRTLFRERHSTPTNEFGWPACLQGIKRNDREAGTYLLAA